MGYASYLEDIRDRLAEDLRLMYGEITKLRSSRNSSASSKIIADQVRSLNTIHRQCQGFLDQINKLLELGTSPELDIAVELLKVKDENAKLKLKNANLYRDHASSDNRVLDLEEENKKLKKEIKDLKDQLLDLDKKLSNPRNFAAAIDAYSDKEAINRNKPNELKRKR